MFYMADIVLCEGHKNHFFFIELIYILFWGKITLEMPLLKEPGMIISKLNLAFPKPFFYISNSM